jgi:hypothetical protein
LSDNLEVGEVLQRMGRSAEDILSATELVPVFVQYPVQTFIRVSPFRPGEKHVINWVFLPDPAKMYIKELKI